MNSLHSPPPAAHAAGGYRPEVDGLRALALLPVILYHAGFELVSGGFLGVDVFFVISGYLITSIILRERAEDRFSILKFYERRARRILPALFFVILACLPFALAWMLPWQLAEFGESVAAVALFGANILFWTKSGYFSPASEEMPLIHTWSLGVEEQYYVFFPLLLLATWRFGLRGMAVVFAGLAVISLGLTELGWRRFPAANFYLLPTRAWELLAGSLLAIWLVRRAAPRGAWAEGGSLLGLAMVIVSMLVFDTETPLPSWRALLPVGGSVLLILCATPGNFAGRLLASRPLVTIGLISYSAYLWHQPLFAFARIRSPGEPGPVLMAALALLTLVLAWLTWRYVESPFRNPAKVNRRQILFGATGGSLVALAVGLVFLATSGLPQRLPPDIVRMAELGDPARHDRGDCEATTVDGLATCVFDAGLPRRVVVWGDSHVLALAPGLARTLAAEGWGLTRLSVAGCIPISGVYKDGWQNCVARNEQALAWLASDKAPQIVIVAARWAPAFTGTHFDNGEGGIERPEPWLYRSVRVGGGAFLAPDQIAGELATTVDRLRGAGKTVVLVSSVPEAGWNVPTVLAKAMLFGGGPPRPLSTSMTVFAARNQAVHAAFAALRGGPTLLVVDPSRAFCGTRVAGRCLAEWQGVSYYSDDDHVSPDGATEVSSVIVQDMLAAGMLAGRERLDSAGPAREPGAPPVAGR